MRKPIICVRVNNQTDTTATHIGRANRLITFTAPKLAFNQFSFSYFFSLSHRRWWRRKKKWKSRENCCNWKFLLLLLVAQYWQSQAKALTEFLISFSFHQQMTQLVVSCTRPASSSHVVGCFLFLARAIASEFMKYRIFQPKTLEKNLVKWSFFFVLRLKMYYGVISASPRRWKFFLHFC